MAIIREISRERQGPSLSPRLTPANNLQNKLQNKPAQIGVLGQIADMLLHVGSIDLDRLAGAVRGRERDLVEHALHHRLQPPRADILHARIHRHRHVGNGVDGVFGEFQRYAFGAPSARCIA